MTDEQWDTILAVHVTAPFRILRSAQPVISAAVELERTEGLVVHRKVVNIASHAGVFGNARQVNYASAQAGVEGLTRALSKEWGRLNVNVNAVAFGHIATDVDDEVDVDATRIPLGRAGTREEAANAVYLLCTPESDYISGQTLVCAGGMLL
jgi:3-oxoacyl-[acyl-carrier protein] reductase